MSTNKHGQAPGLTTPKNDNGLTTPHSQPVKPLSKHNAHFITAWTQIKHFVSRFYYDRGIGANSLLLLILLVVYLIWRVAA